MKLIATIFSYIFHPIFIPTIGVYLLFSTPTEPISFIQKDSLYFFQEDFKIRLYSLLAVLTIAAPLLSMLVLKTGKIISSYRLENSEERKVPLIMMIIYLAIVILQLFFMDKDNIIPIIVKTYMLSVALTLGAILVLLKVMKISIHTAAISSLVALMFVYFKTQQEYNYLIIPSLFVLLGIVATSRLVLSQHKSSEIYLGAVLGFATTFLLTSYY